MDISFELYKVFYHVANTMSFSAASEQLFISQSAVSQSIKVLEEKMGCKLFFRNTKKIKLTKEGELLYRHVAQAYNIIKAGERAIEGMQSLEQGEVRIGASDTICKYYLMPYCKKFNELYPGIKLHLTNRTSPQCIEYLKNGSVDFAVINISDRYAYGQIEVKRTKAIRDVFIAGGNYGHLKGREMTLSEVAEYPLLVLEKNSTTREFFDALMAEKGILVKPEVELSSVDLLIDMAKIGLGISFVPDECVEDKIESGEVFVLDVREEIEERYLGIAVHGSIPLSIAAERFVELLERE